MAGLKITGNITMSEGSRSKAMAEVPVDRQDRELAKPARESDVLCSQC